MRPAAGAESIVMVCGEIMTMPGLPQVPSADRIDLGPDGKVVGHFWRPAGESEAGRWARGREDATREVPERIHVLNADLRIHGMMMRFPASPGSDRGMVLQATPREKAVGGFHLCNVGSPVTGNTIFPYGTPFGVQCLLECEGIRVEGQNAVVVCRAASGP